IVFRIYDSSNGVTAVWGQTNSDVYVERGLFSVLLTNLNNSVFPTNSAVCRWLEVEVRDWGATNILAPRKEIVSVPYAINADMVDGMHWWDIVVAATNEMKETDPTVVGWVKDGESWTELKGQGMPACFADDVDNVGITVETDPTVVAWVKDGVTWSELKTQGMPAGFADDVDNVGLLSEDDPQVGANQTHYVPRWDGSALVKGRIYDNNSGLIGIGTESPECKLDVNGNAVIRGPLYLSWGDDRIEAIVPEPRKPLLALYSWQSAINKHVTVLLTPDPRTNLGYNGYGFMVSGLQDSSPDMHVRPDGWVIARTYFHISSDDRVKINEQPLEYGLAQVMALEPKRYDRAASEFDPATEELVFHPEKITTTNDIGFMAQDVQKVIPEAVGIPEDENRTLWSLSYDTIIPVLVKAIQEQQAQIEALKQENQALKSGPLTADFDGDGKADTAMV
ncbi:MAG: tail fiber domain-containing protein, partial [Kiritimatiellae bacterium]|nr:tail fiber domain-containing protein [Kiritimatiellia bacterium]